MIYFQTSAEGFVSAVGAPEKMHLLLSNKLTGILTRSTLLSWSAVISGAASASQSSVQHF